jgi:hypothetical protein
MGQIPVLMKRGEIILSNPISVEQAIPALECLKKVISLENPILEGHPAYEQDYLDYIPITHFKNKEEIARQLIERLQRKVYIDGFCPEDL